ncbi:response regulator, partial [Salmonella enterica subsp. enterica]|nr:response regulator [Salmonella enterica subsp. enterica serovar Enteritidis]
MTARILVVDDVPANRKLLEARLRAEYFDVVSASSGPEALEACENGKIDLVLLDVMMPGMDGFEVCKQLKVNPATSYIPVVMITALDGMADRIEGLRAGADDFLTKPVNDLQLMTRVKSLVRLKSLTDELRLRASTTRNIGLEEIMNEGQPSTDAPARILLIDDRDSSRMRIQELAAGEFYVDLAGDMTSVLLQAAEGNYDA